MSHSMRKAIAMARKDKAKGVGQQGMTAEEEVRCSEPQYMHAACLASREMLCAVVAWPGTRFPYKRRCFNSVLI